MTLKRLTPLLNVENVSRSIAFYRDHLAFRVTKEWEDGGRVRWASLERSGIHLMLNESHHSDGHERRRRHTYADLVLYFSIDDVDSMHGRLHDSGIAVGKISNEDYGVREFYVRDPDGYEVGFGTPISELTLAN